MIIVIDYGTGEVSKSAKPIPKKSTNREMDMDSVVRPELQEIPVAQDKPVNPIIGTFGDIGEFIDKM